MLSLLRRAAALKNEIARELVTEAILGGSMDYAQVESVLELCEAAERPNR